MNTVNGARNHDDWATNFGLGSILVTFVTRFVCHPDD